LQPLFRPIKGFFKLIRISPLIKNGVALTPFFETKRESNGVTYELKPLELGGDCVFEVGSTSDIVSLALSRLKQIQGIRTRIKFEGSIIEYIVEDISSEDFSLKLGDRVAIKSVSPTLLTNPYVADQHIRRFTINPTVLLWVPYLISQRKYSVSEEASKAAKLLESCLVEHYVSSMRVIHIPYDGQREPALHFRAKYIVLCHEREKNDMLTRILEVARVLGVGASRANGFGTIQIHTNAAKNREK
jgi:hypothetical protein